MSRSANSNVWVRKTHEKPFGGRGIRIRYVNGVRIVEPNCPKAAKSSLVQEMIVRDALQHTPKHLPETPASDHHA
jgi:hypothetical protein